MPVESERGALEALLDLHDEDFVLKAYELILGRAADPGGLANYLAQVRSGVHKGQIIAELARSAEGKLRNPDLTGLRSTVEAYRHRSPSFWKRFVRQLMRAGTEDTQRQLRSIDNQLYRLERNLSTQTHLLVELTALLQGRTVVPDDPTPNLPSSKNQPMQAPPFSRLSLSLRRTVKELQAAIAMKQVR